MPSVGILECLACLPPGFLSLCLRVGGRFKLCMQRKN
jgi:hypothetical protein